MQSYIYALIAYSPLTAHHTHHAPPLKSAPRGTFRLDGHRCARRPRSSRTPPVPDGPGAQSHHECFTSLVYSCSHQHHCQWGQAICGILEYVSWTCACCTHGQLSRSDRDAFARTAQRHYPSHPLSALHLFALIPLTVKHLSISTLGPLIGWAKARQSLDGTSPLSDPASPRHPSRGGRRWLGL